MLEVFFSQLELQINVSVTFELGDKLTENRATQRVRCKQAKVETLFTTI